MCLISLTAPRLVSRLLTPSWMLARYKLVYSSMSSGMAYPMIATGCGHPASEVYHDVLDMELTYLATCSKHDLLHKIKSQLRVISSWARSLRAVGLKRAVLSARRLAWHLDWPVIYLVDYYCKAAHMRPCNTSHNYVSNANTSTKLASLRVPQPDSIFPWVSNALPHCGEFIHDIFLSFSYHLNYLSIASRLKQKDGLRRRHSLTFWTDVPHFFTTD